MIILGFFLVIAYANSWTVPSWAWVLFGIQVFIEIVAAVAKELK